MSVEWWEANHAVPHDPEQVIAEVVADAYSTALDPHDAAHAALAALHDAGFVVVPAAPDDRMVEAGEVAWAAYWNSPAPPGFFADAMRAALSAALRAASEGGEDG